MLEAQPWSLLPAEVEVVLHRQCHEILLDIRSALDVPAGVDAMAEAIGRASRLACIVVLIDDGGRRTVLGGTRVPAGLREDPGAVGAMPPAALNGTTWRRLACCRAALDDEGELWLVAYERPTGGVSGEMARAWLQTGMPILTLALRHAQLALKLTHGSIELEAEVERRTAEVRRLLANERALLARLQEQTMQLQAANADLRQLDEMKTAIISSVSHELRTPISTIKTLTQVLRRRTASAEKLTHYLAVMDAECDRQMQLISDLLALARLEAGGQALERSPQDLAGMVGVVAERMRDATEAAGQRLVINLPAGPLPPVLAHPSELEQVIGNLLSNAHKFTPAGGDIELSLSQCPALVCLSVRDTGCGIPAAHVDRIFDKFYRVPQHSRQVPGTGLGLAITRRVVESMGGAIRVASAEGRGSCFTVEWPLEGTHDGTYSPG